MKRAMRGVCLMAIFTFMVAGLTGCPTSDYDVGYELGFLQDEWYWQGFDDGFDTTMASPIFYQGEDIPNVESPEYDRGYYDGLWVAYNDGYFVDYDYAFTIGFSEGYDAAFYSDYVDFLIDDDHIELYNGGWGDGYNDGFSEGSYYGASDYEEGYEFDWLLALDDYRAGYDIDFGDLGGTGAYGDVVLYEYGTDPGEKAAAGVRLAAPLRMIRNGGAKADAGELVARPLTAEVEDALNKRPETSPRSTRPVALESTWLERIQAYESYQRPDSKARGNRSRG